MKSSLPLLLVLLTAIASAQESVSDQGGHWDPTHNFTVFRMIVLNDQNEILMTRQDFVWAPPSFIFNQRQYANEGLDSLSAAYGITTTQPRLHGYFGYKYEYHPYATMRAYYMANYISGDLNLPMGYDEVRWIPIDQALSMIPVDGIKEITKRIVSYREAIWGGSFLVYRDGKHHRTRVVEPFYPLFE